jgi:hypothetical protein
MSVRDDLDIRSPNLEQKFRAVIARIMGSENIRSLLPES